MKQKWTDEEIQILKEQYPIIGRDKCAKLLNRSLLSIMGKAGKLKIKAGSIIRKYAAKNRKKPENTFYKVNPDTFINCNTKEAAYALGFLWADGNLNNNKSNHCRISMELSQPDFEFVKNIFLLTGKWGINYRQRKNRKPQGLLITGQKPLYNFLKDNDYEIKSGASPDKILSKIPEELKPYWWRGYSDGDGCFYFNAKNITRHFMFCSTYDQNWKFVEELFLKLNIKYAITRYLKLKSKYSIIRIADKQSIKNFGDYIYKINDNVKLQRKYDKFIEIISSYKRGILT